MSEDKATRDAAAKQLLIQSLMTAKFTRDRAQQVVDIAFHARQQAMDAVVRVSGSAPDPGLTMASFQIAVQLVMIDCQNALQSTIAVADENKLPHNQCEIML